MSTLTIDFPGAIPTALPKHPAPQGSTSLDHRSDESQTTRVEGPFSDSQAPYDPQPPGAVGSLHPAAANPATDPKSRSQQQGTTSVSQKRFAAHDRHADGTLHSTGPIVVTTSIPLASQSSSTPGIHPSTDTHVSRDAGTLPPAANRVTTPIAPSPRGPLLFDGYLCLVSDSLDDIEALRIATDNRIRSLTRTAADVDGEYRGLGLDARSPEVARAMAMAESIQALEHQTTLDLQRVLRKHPLHGWVKRSRGIGEKQAARLLAVIGDPYWNDLHDRPRTVSELSAYCGYSVNSGRAQRRTKGVPSNWNDKAKMRAFLMAQSCVKSGGPYREVYDQAREQYADAVHPHDCVRCGPAGKPALEGSALSAGHQHARALRLVAKTILKDLWIEARTVHEQGDESHE